MQYYTYNGKFYLVDTPAITPGSRGLRYGDGVFETIKVSNSKIILPNEHFERLWKGLNLLQFDLPKLFTPQKLQQGIITLVQKNKHQQYARVRLMVFKGDGGLYDAKNHLPNYTIQSWALPPEKGLLNENGLVVGFYQDAKKTCDAFSNIKHNNFLPYTMAALYAKKNKWNDALVQNQYGNICDSTIANIFICKDEQIFTPPLAEGCIEGVTRNNVIKMLKQNNFNIEEKPLTQNNILQANEVFLTNAINNIQWVGQIEDKKYKNVMVQKIYKLIFQPN
jgi:branched-chain amino acid aminotransferase